MANDVVFGGKRGLTLLIGFPRLIAFDLDGTVLSSAGELSPRTLAAFAAAKERGCVLVAATGRAMKMVPACVMAIPDLDYIITSNGACVTVPNGKCIASAPMGRDAVEKIFAANRKLGVAYQVFFQGRAEIELKSLWIMRGNFAGIGNVSMRNQNRFLKSVKLIISAKHAVCTSTVPVEKLSCIYTDKKVFLRQLERFQKWGFLEAIAFKGCNIEITAFGVSKGSALQSLCSRLGISKNDAIAFGNGGNDLSMRQAVGTFIAMGNADEPVKTATDYTTKSITQDGVAYVLNCLCDPEITRLKE